MASALTECGPVTKTLVVARAHCPAWTLSPWQACPVPPCWPCHHLPLLSRAGREKALGIFRLCLPQTKKEGKCQRGKKIKVRQDMAILQHLWQLLRLPGKSPPLCVLQATAWSSLPKWDQTSHPRGALWLHTGRLWHSWE